MSSAAPKLTAEQEAERVLLAGLLLVADSRAPAWVALPARARQLVHEADLQDRRLAAVWRAWAAVVDRGELAGPLQVAAELEATAIRHTGLSDLQALCNDGPATAEQVVDAAQRVRAAAADRRATLLMARAQDAQPELRAQLLEQALSEVRGRAEVKGPKGLAYTWMSDVQPEQLQWLWHGRIPRGCISLLAGDPGQGKSALTMALAAMVTRGWMLPGHQEDGTPGRVVFVAHEDPRAAVQRARMDAAGVDVSRVASLDDMPILPDGIARLETTVRDLGAQLVVIDPVGAYLSPKINAFSDSELRQALAPLQGMAERTGCAVLLVAHLNKGAGRAGLYRVGGSIGLVGQSRMAMLVAPDPQNPERRVLAPLKQNLTKPVASLVFTLEDKGGHPQVHWHGETKLGVEALLAADDGRSKKDPQALKNAVDILRQLLALGPMAAVDVEEQAEAAGVSEMTLRRARKRLRVVTERRGGIGPAGHWWWRLPSDEELAATKDPRRARA